MGWLVMGDRMVGPGGMLGDWVLPLGVLCVIALVIGVVLGQPAIFGKGIQTGPSEIAELPLVEMFPDEATETYLTRFAEVDPQIADDLTRRLNQARRVYTSTNEQALIVLASAWTRDLDTMAHLEYAPADNVAALVNHLRDGLRSLTDSGAPYCLGRDIQRFALYSEQDFYRLYLELLAYGEPGYEYAIETETILIDAVGKARLDPSVRTGPTYGDQRFVQDIGRSLLFDPEMSAMFFAEGKGKAVMDEAMGDVDFCAIGVRVLDQVSAMPKETQARYWSEGVRQVRSGAAMRAFQSMFVY